MHLPAAVAAATPTAQWREKLTYHYHQDQQCNKRCTDLSGNWPIEGGRYSYVYYYSIEELPAVVINRRVAICCHQSGYSPWNMDYGDQLIIPLVLREVCVYVRFLKTGASTHHTPHQPRGKYPPSHHNQR